MALMVCDSAFIDQVTGQCLKWVEFSYLPPLAITYSQSIDISVAVAKICGLLIAYTLITRALKIS